MRTAQSALLWIVVALLALSAAEGVAETPSAGSINLAPNPGFELPDVAGYARQALATNDDVRPFSGRFSLRQDAVPDHLWNCVQMTSDTAIAVQAGRLYSLSVFTRNTLTNGAAFFGLRECQPAGEQTITYTWRPVPLGEPDWTPHTLLIQPTAKTRFLQIYFRLAPECTGGSVWWDNVEVKEMDNPFTDLRPTLLQLAPLASSVFTRAGNRTTPEQLTVCADAGEEAVGGALRMAITTTRAPTRTLWAATNTVAWTGPLSVSVPTADLPEDRYELRVAIESSDGTARMAVAKPLAVLPSCVYPALPPVHSSRIGPDGNLWVNDRPFLGIEFYHNPLTHAGLKELRDVYGATTASVWGDNSIDALCTNVDLAWQAGLYSWAVLFHPAMFDAQASRWKDKELAETVNRLKQHPGLVGYDLSDEPDAGIPAAEVRRARDLVRSLDPNHVILVNLCFKNKFAEYAGISDLASYDHYPLPENGLAPIREHNRIMRATAPGKPLVCILQTYRAPHGAMPSPAELWAEVFLNVCEGMTIFHYYSWYDPPPSGSLFSDPELRSAARVLNHELHSLQPFLFSTNRLAVAADGAGAQNLVSLAKQVGDSVELVVMNPDAWPVNDFTVRLCGHKIREATTMMGQGGRVEVRRGRMLDSLPPYGVGLYRLQIR